MTLVLIAFAAIVAGLHTVGLGGPSAQKQAVDSVLATDRQLDRGKAFATN
jgi:hypothetical protein